MHTSKGMKISESLIAGIVFIMVAIVYFMLSIALSNMATISLMVGAVILVLGIAFLAFYFIGRIRKKQNTLMRM